MFSNITSAQVGSAVRWVITTGGSYLVTLGIGTAVDWTTIAGGMAAAAMLLWSFWSNSKKVA